MMTSILLRLEERVVANLSQFGFGPLHEFAALRGCALPLRPKTVVWTFSEGNDLGDVIHTGTRSPRNASRPGPLPPQSFSVLHGTVPSPPTRSINSGQ
jgi:hypothetical protein